MFCKYCGSQNDDEAKFCDECGKSLSETNENISGGEKSVTSNGAEKTSENRKKYLLYAIIGFIVVVIIGIILAIFIISLSGDNESSKSKRKSKNKVSEAEMGEMLVDEPDEAVAGNENVWVNSGDNSLLDVLSGKTDEIEKIYIQYINNEIPDSDNLYFRDRYRDYFDVYYYFIQSKYAEHPALVINYNDAIVRNDIFYYTEDGLEIKAGFGRAAVSGSVLVDETYIVHDYTAPCMCEEAMILKLDENYNPVSFADIWWDSEYTESEYCYHDGSIYGHDLDSDITDGVSYLIKNGYISNHYTEYYGVDETEGKAILAMSAKEWQEPYRKALEKADDSALVCLIYIGNDNIPELIFSVDQDLYMYSIIDGELVENKFEDMSCHIVHYYDGYIYLDGLTGLGGDAGRFSYDEEGFHCDIYGFFFLDEDEDKHYSEYINYITGENLSGEEEYIYQKVMNICPNFYDGSVEGEEALYYFKQDLLNTWYY